MIGLNTDSGINLIKKRIFRETGFTLVELLVASGILVVAVLAVYLMLEGGYNTYGKVDNQIAAQSEARRNISRMSKYIRECKQITQASAYELTIESDIDDDNVPENVHFYLSDSNGDSLYELNQTVDGSVTTELGRYVTNPTTGTSIFTYYDAGGNEITNMDQAKTASRSIRIKLIVDLKTSESPSAYNLESRVHLRNFE
jgi:prepilin-type N-terminal cleavage/methylation domain-containing protein